MEPNKKKYLETLLKLITREKKPSKLMKDRKTVKK
jgi:hypothetical protein